MSGTMHHMNQFILCQVINDGPDCSNGGISGEHDAVVLTDGFDREHLGIPCVRVDSIVLGGRTTPRVSVIDHRPDQLGPMSGGAKVHSDDPRFQALLGTTDPVMLLDRFETPAEYARQW